MKTTFYDRYGSAEQIEIRETTVPKPKGKEVLVRLVATSLNSSDWEMLSGSPAYIRMYGLRRPKFNVLGSDVAGVVAEIGNEVQDLQVGDAVFADLFDRWGGLAEYVVAPEDLWVKKPDKLSFEEAASLPQAGVVALQGLRDKGQIREGEKVLVNGAGGGAGTFAIQLAKHFGTEVTGVDHTNKMELMREYGADETIDYTQTDFTEVEKKYDLVLDLVARRGILDCKRALSAKGRYVLVGGDMSSLLQAAILGPLCSTGEKKLGILGHKQNAKDMQEMADLVLKGTLKPVIKSVFKLDDSGKALELLGSGQAKGKVIVKM